MKTHTSAKESGYLEVFQEVTRLISTIHDPQKVMDLVVARLPKLLEVDAATIRLYDSAADTFVLGASYGVSEEYLSRSTIDTKEVMAALKEGRPIARSAVDVVCAGDSCSTIAREGIKSAMSLPIIFKDQNIGLLRLLSKENRTFSKAEINFSMSLAEQVGMSIANGRMFQEMENQVRFFRALRRISRMVNSTLDLDQILSTIVDTMPELMGVKGCTIRLLGKATNRLELVAAKGLSQEYLNRGSIQREDSIFRVLKGKPVAIYDAAHDPRVDYHEEIAKEGIKSILAIPISNEKEIIGVLRLLSITPKIFSENEINFAMTVAEEGGNAIDKARLYRKITLLFNQIEEHERFLQTVLDSLWMQLLVVDLNKRIIMANHQFLKKQAKKEEEIIGEHYDDVIPWQKGNTEQCPIEKVFKTSSSVSVVQKDGEEGANTWFERQLTPVVDGNNKLEFVLEAVRDITSQKLLELEKLESMKLQGVIEMAGTAAHELNSPLFAALGTAQLLRDDISDENIKDEMDMIIRNLQKIADLTREMTAATGFETRDYVGDTKLVTLKSKE